jgi:hypothetical protein
LPWADPADFVWWYPLPVDEHLTQAPHGVKILAEIDGVTLELPEANHARAVAPIVLSLLAPSSPLLPLVKFFTAFVGTILPLLFMSVLLQSAEQVGLLNSLLVIVPAVLLLCAGAPGGMAFGLRLPDNLYERINRPRSGRHITMRLGLHDITLHCGGRLRTILLSEVLFIEPGPPPKLVLTGAERLEFADALSHTTQKWLVQLLESARTRRGVDEGEAEIPTDLRALQQQTDSA